MTASHPHKPEPPPVLGKGGPLYHEFMAERGEILRHKWLESERAGHDIGFERALMDWIRFHRKDWIKGRESQTGKNQGNAPRK